MAKAYGDRATKIQMRLGVLKQAAHLGDVPKAPPERCHQLTADRDEAFAVVVKDQWRLVFVPNHDPIPRKADGGIDEERVTAIEIQGVIDYHG